MTGIENVSLGSSWIGKKKVTGSAGGEGDFSQSPITLCRSKSRMKCSKQPGMTDYLLILTA